MNPSLPSLVRQLLANPSYHHLVIQNIAHVPGLASSFDTLLSNPQEDIWLRWFVQVEQQVPTLVPNLIRQFQAIQNPIAGEETSRSHGRIPSPSHAAMQSPSSSGMAWNTPSSGGMLHSVDDEDGESTMMEPNTLSSGEALSGLGVPIASPPPARSAPPISPRGSSPSLSHLPSTRPTASSPSMPMMPSTSSSSMSSNFAAHSDPSMPIVSSKPYQVPSSKDSMPSMPQAPSMPSMPSMPSTPIPQAPQQQTPSIPSIPAAIPISPSKMSLLSTTMDVPMLAANLMSSGDKKGKAQQNSAHVYSVGVGWHRFQFHTINGDILPEDVNIPETRWMHCRVEVTNDGPVMRELHLHLSEQKILVYRNLIWYWQAGPSDNNLTRAGINDISTELPADVVDLLLDLVSPGLFDHAADAHLSYSFAPSNTPAPPSSTKAGKPRATGENSHSPSISSGEHPLLSQSPFAIRPVSIDDADTTMMRKALLEPLQASPNPRELTIQSELPLSWFQRWRKAKPKRQTLATLQVNQEYPLHEWGLTITFLIESTAASTFPWVQVVREIQPHRNAHVTLLWNQEQHQILPPGFKSTGALSRSTDIGSLQIHFQIPNQQPLNLFIYWS